MPDGNVHYNTFQTKPGRQYSQENIGIHAIEQHLKDAIERHQTRRILRVAMCQFIPHDHHGNAARQANHDQTCNVFRIAAQEDDRQHEHQDWTNDPVLNERKGQDLLIAEDIPQLLILHLGEWRVHHQDQADRNRDIGCTD